MKEPTYGERGFAVPKDGWYRVEAGRIVEMDNGGYRMDADGQVVSAQDALNRATKKYQQVLRDAADMQERLSTVNRNQLRRFNELMDKYDALRKVTYELLEAYELQLTLAWKAQGEEGDLEATHYRARLAAVEGGLRDAGDSMVGSEEQAPNGGGNGGAGTPG